MTLKTIECRLYAPSDTLRYIWELMAGKNTPLINELLHRLGQQADFETWFKAKQVPKTAIKAICDDLKGQEAYRDQPGRFYTSAIALTHYMLKSWIAIQRSLQQRLEGKQRWLEMLKSDKELEQQCQRSIAEIRDKARTILDRMTEGEVSRSTKSKKSRKKGGDRSNEGTVPLFDRLFQAYNEEKDPLASSALAYLLKNNCQIPDEEEDAERYNHRRRKKEIEIQRLQQQIDNRFPIGRDLTGEQWVEILSTVNNSIPKDECEASAWQARLLQKIHEIPYPVIYESNTDLTWSKDSREHLQVTFNGLIDSLEKRGLDPHFEVRCDRRHLDLFDRFWKDQEFKAGNEERCSSGLFLLRSARLLWREGKGKGNPWDVHHLYLQCSIDIRLWTEEGTGQIQRQKISELEIERIKMKPELTFPIFFRSRSLPVYFTIWKTIIGFRFLKFSEKGDLAKARKEFQNAIQRTESCLNNLTISPPRPQKPPYQGNSEIMVGVSMGLARPATVAVVNVVTGEVLTYRSIKQLLGENYNLLVRQRQQKHRLSHQRHKAQKKDAPNRYGESELGQYLDRLIAKAIVKLAREYRAHSIAVPKLRQIRESIHSEIRARAERKIPGYKEGQQKYAQQYRESVHRWSYNRLIESIHQASAPFGIAIEAVSQSFQGNPQEQARTNALAAYNGRFESAR